MTLPAGMSVLPHRAVKREEPLRDLAQKNAFAEGILPGMGQKNP
jgi:hypothetical protein